MHRHNKKALPLSTQKALTLNVEEKKKKKKKKKKGKRGVKNGSLGLRRRPGKAKVRWLRWFS